MLDFPRIRSFIEAASCLNFSEAAARLYMSQSSLSRNIAQLEQSLGIQLFVRSNRTVALTREGAYLYTRLKGLFDEVGNAIAVCRQMQQGKVGSVRLGIPGATIQSPMLYELLSSFAGQWQQYDCIPVPSNYKALRGALISGELDAIITKRTEIEGLDLCSAQTLSFSQPAAVLRRDHPAVRQTPFCLNDLKDSNFISFSPADFRTYAQELEACCSAAGFKPRIATEAAAMHEIILQVVLQNYVTIADESDLAGFASLVAIVPLNGFISENVLAWTTSNSNPALQALIETAQSFDQSSQGK